ncbi:MAG TPA: ATP-dependent Clp protease adaptor ClpS [Gemmataceae bacterium]|nr:ATP-dependent Clp protease adaptor ClpS [Gemmataceae bacterium]
MSDESPLTDVMVSTKPKETTKTRRVPPYNVILLNDDHHTMEFVIEVLCKALGYTVERSYQLMMQAHNGGRTIVWTGPKEVAELKAEQIQTFHQRLDDGRELGPLGCEIEPAPGG